MSMPEFGEREALMTASLSHIGHLAEDWLSREIRTSEATVELRLARHAASELPPYRGSDREGRGEGRSVRCTASSALHPEQEAAR